jgi:hypothetical protein
MALATNPTHITEYQKTTQQTQTQPQNNQQAFTNALFYGF